MPLMERQTPRQLRQIVEDDALDYDIRICAQTEIYRRQRPSEGARDAKTKDK